MKKHYLLALLIGVLHGCATYQTKYAQPFSVDVADAKKDVEHTFYLIGDRKVNEYTEDFLGALQPGQRRRFSFAPPEWRDKREKGGWLACVFTRE